MKKTKTWVMEEEDADYILENVGNGSAENGARDLVKFHKEYSGKVDYITLMSSKLDSEWKKIKNEAESLIGIHIDDLKKREEIIRQKEAVYLAIKKLMKD